jgi:hypothetical protein
MLEDGHRDLSIFIIWQLEDAWDATSASDGDRMSFPRRMRVVVVPYASKRGQQIRGGSRRASRTRPR